MMEDKLINPNEIIAVHKYDKVLLLDLTIPILAQWHVRFFLHKVLILLKVIENSYTKIYYNQIRK